MDALWVMSLEGLVDWQSNAGIQKERRKHPETIGKHFSKLSADFVIQGGMDLAWMLWDRENGLNKFTSNPRWLAGKLMNVFHRNNVPFSSPVV